MAKDRTSKTTRDLAMFYSNVRSIHKNLNLLLSLIAQHKQKCDIIAATETWLKKNENVCIPGYKTVSESRDSTSRGGGVAFFVRCGLAFSIVSSATVSLPHIETLFLRSESSLIVGVVYRPPNSSIPTFLDKLEEIFLLLLNDNIPVVIVGDINIDSINSNNIEYTNVLQSYNFHNIITVPTRITASSATLIDHVLTNEPTNVDAHVLQQTILDH